MKSSQNHRTWNSISKAKIKTPNRMKLNREFGQNRTIKHNRINIVHFWLRSFFKQIRFLIKQIASNALIYDENHVQCFNEMAKISVWKEIAHDYRGLSVQSKSIRFNSF